MDIKTLKDFTKKRSELIASLMSSMDGQVKDNQKKLLEKVLEKFVDKLEKDVIVTGKQIGRAHV